MAKEFKGPGGSNTDNMHKKFDKGRGTIPSPGYEHTLNPGKAGPRKQHDINLARKAKAYQERKDKNTRMKTGG